MPGPILEFMDNGTFSGLDKYDEAHDVVHKQYEAGLLTGQKTNRPEPPKPVPNGFEQFFQIYWSKGNNPAAIELKLFEMAEDHLVQLHVSLAHQHWGYTYTVGWAAMNRAYVEIMDEDTQLKEKLALQERVAKLEGKRTSSLFDFDSTDGKITLGSRRWRHAADRHARTRRMEQTQEERAVITGAAQTMEEALTRPSNRILPSLGIILVAGGFLVLGWLGYLWLSPGQAPYHYHLVEEGGVDKFSKLGLEAWPDLSISKQEVLVDGVDQPLAVVYLARRGNAKPVMLDWENRSGEPVVFVDGKLSELTAVSISDCEACAERCRYPCLVGHLASDRASDGIRDHVHLTSWRTPYRAFALEVR